MVAMYVEYNEIKRRKENENGIEERMGLYIGGGEGKMCV